MLVKGATGGSSTQMSSNVELGVKWAVNHVYGVLGPDSIQRCHLTSIGNLIVEIRRS